LRTAGTKKKTKEKEKERKQNNISKITNAKMTGGVAQVVMCLPSKHKSLSSTFRLKKKCCCFKSLSYGIICYTAICKYFNLLKKLFKLKYTLKAGDIEVCMKRRAV
jgi:hypothetical protein